ncbi:MFS transporter [Nocardia sp. NPDC051030]|uniref:MFS transporter n=1 Tax=Nocardia sp. NPDC051030 TaxID=3155162 RepID=UPI00342FCDEC
MNRYWVLALACIASFITVVDLAIVNVALPGMKADLGLGEGTLQWVVIAYGLPFGGLLLLAGRLGDIWGRRRVLQAGITIFTLASLTAGFADTTAALIASRAAQGVGAALIAPSALAVVAATFTELKQRNSALGVYGATGGGAASVGVLAGGLLTDGPGWRWIFYVNVPIGVLLVAASFVLLRDDRGDRAGAGFDPRSALAATGGLMLGLYALNRGVEDGWTATSTLTLSAVALALLAAFVRSEQRTAKPLVSRELLRNRPMIVADLTALFGFGSFFAFIFLTTLLMQQQLGYSATKTGLVWLITSISAFMIAGLTGAVLAERFGARRMLTVALLLMGVAAGLLTFIPADPSFAVDFLPALLCAGLAVGILGPTVQIAALAQVHEAGFGGASGLVETSRELGGAMVIAVVSTVLVAGGSETALLTGLHDGFGVITGTALAGTLVAAIGFGIRSRRTVVAPVPA